MANVNVVSSGISEDDVWDDSELIRAYDKAVKLWKRTKPEDSSTSTTPGPGPWVVVESNDIKNEQNDRVSTVTFTNYSGDAMKETTAKGVYIATHEVPTVTSEQQSIPTYDETCTNENSDLGNFLPQFPVPPMPASLACPDGTFSYDKGELPALLMSWYMSGYQAGYFDAKRDLEKKKIDQKK